MDKKTSSLGTYQQANGIGSTGLSPRTTLSAGNYNTPVTGAINAMKATLQKGTLSYSDDSSDKSVEYLKEAIQAGYDFSSKARIDNSISNMVRYAYEQTLQNICGTENLDPVMMMAIASVQSEADPSQANGMFGIPGMDGNTPIKEQIEKFAEFWKNKVSAIEKDGNSLGPVQSMVEWKKTGKFVYWHKRIRYLLVIWNLRIDIYSTSKQQFVQLVQFIKLIFHSSSVRSNGNESEVLPSSYESI